MCETPYCYLEVRHLSKLGTHEKFQVEISKTAQYWRVCQQKDKKKTQIYRLAYTESQYIEVFLNRKKLISKFLKKIKPKKKLISEFLKK